MAQIRMDNFKRVEKNRTMVHDVVYATYTVERVLIDGNY